jgi:hypothetical protein
MPEPKRPLPILGEDETEGYEKKEKIFFFILKVRQIFRDEFGYEYRVNSVSDIKDALVRLCEMPNIQQTADTVTGIYLTAIKQKIEELENPQNEPSKWASDELSFKNIFNPVDRYVNQDKREPETHEENIDSEVFITILRSYYPRAYDAIRNGYDAGLIDYDKFEKIHFNFKCDKGCVGHIFSKAGCTDFKLLSRHITINGEETSSSKLKNYRNNPAPASWKQIKPIFFPATPK